MKRVFDYIEKNKKRIVDLTKKLVSIPTVNPPGENYEVIVAFLKKECKSMGLKTREIRVPKKELKKHGINRGSARINLLAEWNTRAEKTLHLNGHYDVVPATSSWSSPPFKPVVRGGKIFGRGTEDMKGNIASVLMSVEALKVNNLKPRCNVELSFTPDEETGGAAGFGYLVKKGIVKPDYAIGEGYQNDFFSYGNKGMVWFRIVVHGKSCHGSEPHKGINSFEKMLMVASELVKLKNRVAKRTTSHATRREIDRHATMVLGGELFGGSKINIVPDRSVFTIDRRVLPEERLEDVKSEVIDAIERLKKNDRDLKVDVEIFAREEPAVSRRDSIIFKEFSDSISKVTGRRGRCALLAGATDMRFLIRKGIPCVGYSPDGGHSCHGDNEYVNIRSLIDTAKILARVIANVK
ncbi:MAG: M20 family metallopeptidase [Candidatus Omnitrophota bacterium]